jgi:hypothetical protein
MSKSSMCRLSVVAIIEITAEKVGLIAHFRVVTLSKKWQRGEKRENKKYVLRTNKYVFP